MPIQQRKEIEIKLKIGDNLKSFDEYRYLLNQLKFKHVSSRVETDFLPDTDDGLCKKNHLLLRFRKVESHDTTKWLLTLKKRIDTNNVMDFVEIETDFSNIDNDTFNYINQLLFENTKLTLPTKVLKASSIKQVRDIVSKCGFMASRILLDKYREEYSKATDNVTLDFFPDGMGAYMEIESYTRAKLDAVAKKLGVVPKDIITTDYGDLLKEHKKYLSNEQQRIALFSDSIRSKYLEK